MLKGSTLLLALLFMLPPAWAENWPAAQWSKGPAASGPALEALEAYAFAPATRRPAWASAAMPCW